MSFCAIDFGTSNSAVALPGAGHSAGHGAGHGAGGVRLAELEPGRSSTPTAVFYFAENLAKCFGREAIAHYVDGHDGRLMRSMKSILGSGLMDQATEVGGTRLPYLDIIANYLLHLKRTAEAQHGSALERVVLGRPVYFVDGDPARDAAAQAGLEYAARRVGFREVAFQYEPIAAAFDYESRIAQERLVLVAGTDFDQRVELAAVLGEFGYGSVTPDGREMPSRPYYELSTWHLINTLYTPKRIAEFELLRYLYADPAQHRRFMRVLHARLGHLLAGAAEDLKIAVADGGSAQIGLDTVEAGLHIAFDALYFTGGSTGLRCLSQRIAAAFPRAEPVFGDRFASVAAGLGIHAARLFS